MPGATAVRRTDCGHTVYFHASDDDLSAMAGARLASVVAAGGAAVVIAEEPCRRRIETTMEAAGIDLAGARAARRLVTADAERTLGRFLVDGAIDPARFEAAVGALIRSVAASPVAVYGEMVAVLWEAANVPAALELEERWNGLAADLDFSLLCGYPAGLFEAGDCDGFDALCGLHDDVVAGAPSAAAAEVTRRFPSSLRSPGAARRYVADMLSAWGLDHLVDDVSLVLSELATNAVVHGRSDFTVGLARHGGTVRVLVGDRSGRDPAASECDPASLGGRGLRLVGSIATRWGHDVVDGGKLVWAELSPGARASGRNGEER